MLTFYRYDAKEQNKVYPPILLKNNPHYLQLLEEFVHEQMPYQFYQ